MIFQLMILYPLKKKNKLLMSKFFISVIIIFLSGCSFHSNEIYYNKKTSAIVSCSGSKLTSLSIISENKKEYYTFKLQEHSLGSDTFYLFEDNPGYKLFKIGVPMAIEDYELLPNTEYVISNNSEHHRPSSKITIKTDDQKKIKYASKTSCN